jgi:magnesium-transporting ATPase (P-type)
VSCPWAQTTAAVAEALGTDLDAGLSTSEVARRLDEIGPNELVQEPPRAAWRRLLDQFVDPLVGLLLAAIVVSLLAWWFDGADEAPIEAGVIAAIVIANALLGFWQERKAERAVDALRDLTASQVRVIRDNRVESVTSTALVPGDVVLFAEGDMVGADCRITDSASLQIAEAALTGESMPVAKAIALVARDSDLGDRSNMAYNGTAVVRGRGRGVVVATSMDTEIGRIAALLGGASEERTPLQQQIAWLGKALGITVVVLAAVVVAAILVASPISGAADVIDALLVGVSLAVAAVPEGLPAILSVVLALGVQRMASQRAIVKRLSSVETLGSASVICTDKTGTLTRNEMTIVKVVTPSIEVDVTGIGYEPVGEVRAHGRPLHDEALRREVELVLEGGSLANDATLRADGDRWEVLGDPTEAAFLVAERKLGLTAARSARFERVAEVPFTSERKLMTTVDLDSEAEHQPHHHDRREFVLVTKGAPDVLLGRCSHERVGGDVIELTDERRDAIQSDVERLADDALRTLAVAYRRLDEVGVDVDESLEHGLVHLGVVGIVDPPRPEVIDAVADAQRAGIRVIMITGDHPRTAARIGQQLGIEEPSRHRSGVTGAELAGLDDHQFADAVRQRSIFARVSPEQKLRIVEALQHDDRIVAMTGDGVNDAPALRQAEIGVAMGINGTEVSKEASDMILADDNFATILSAVREGREIFSDIRKFLRYLLASNAGEVLVMFVGVLAAGAIGLADATGADGLTVPLLATQILWINLVTDSALALALGVDPAVEDVMDDPPRGVDDRIVDGPMVATIALIGATTAIVGLIALDLELPGGLLGGAGTIESARTMVFTTVVLAQIFNAFNARSDTVSAFVRPFDNRLLWGAAVLTLVSQLAVVHLPPLQRAFDTEALDATQWLICTGLASAVLWVDEIRKLAHRR